MDTSKELLRKSIAIDGDVEVSDDCQSLTVRLETRFDVEKKFNVDVSSEDTWLNFYATYNPFADTVRMSYTVESGDFSHTNDYHPTENEAEVVKELITEKLQHEHGKSPQEFCHSHCELREDVYVYSNTTARGRGDSLERRNQVIKFCYENGYEICGSYACSIPMSRCGTELQWILDYCRSRGISKIVVDRKADLGGTAAEVNKVVGLLCAQGFIVETAGQGQRYIAKLENTVSDENENTELKMGGQT